MGHVRLVFQTLKEHQLFAKYSKCEYLWRSVTFLGHIISGERVKINLRKTEVVQNFPRPLT